jgi:hypothetical protein
VIKPKNVTDFDMMFGGKAMELLPKYESIPNEFKIDGTQNKWVKLTNDWFYSGLTKAEWIPQDGIDTKKALRHIKAILGSWDPKHEHKIAGCAYLASQFFKDVKYEVWEKE